jgi:hypothetical protein
VLLGSWGTHHRPVTYLTNLSIVRGTAGRMALQQGFASGVARLLGSGAVASLGSQALRNFSTVSVDGDTITVEVRGAWFAWAFKAAEAYMGCTSAAVPFKNVPITS